MYHCPMSILTIHLVKCKGRHAEYMLHHGCDAAYTLANVKYQKMYPILAKTEQQICSKTALSDCGPVLLQERKGDQFSVRTWWPVTASQPYYCPLTPHIEASGRDECSSENRCRYICTDWTCNCVDKNTISQCLSYCLSTKRQILMSVLRKYH